MERKLSALVVDDEDNARILLKKLLEETLLFNDIRLAQSVDSANTELARFEPDIIFLDIKMPGKDGFAFIHSASIKGQNLDLEYNDDDESFLGMDSKTCKQMCERIYDRWSRSMADTIVDSSQSESYILSSSYANGKKQ